ncbi:hypothetical protein SAMN06295900_12253 [Trinickia caryophylli]|uniref:Uncharacterized protein n=1 Tax=Trinickia caryophylli TaxID=28094 RepID=A0A1X7H808_TRICW|nr:hypothetical protein SAMN06295900_12253 [Trinickia caryophylli]
MLIATLLAHSVLLGLFARYAMTAKRAQGLRRAYAVVQKRR